MFHVMKAQNYQIRHDMFSVIAIVIFVGISIYQAVHDDITGSEQFAAMGEVVPLICLFICLVIGARIAAWDFNDKTINYELLSGHTRRDLYWGRFASALLWCISLCVMEMLFPLAVSTIRNGWGVQADPVNCMLRLLIAILPVVRMIAAIFLLAFILRNCYITYAVGYVLIGGMMLAVQLLTEASHLHLEYVLGYTTLGEVLVLSNSHMEFVNGADMNVYDSAISISSFGAAAVSSIVVSVVCLLAGYAVFKKRDME